MIQYFDTKFQGLDRFAAFTGRSLETFVRKNTFEKIKHEKIQDRKKKKRLKEFERERRRREYRNKINQDLHRERIIKQDQDSLEKIRIKNQENHAVKIQEILRIREKKIKDKENREKTFLEGNKRFQSALNQKPLYKKLEELYEISNIIPEKTRTQMLLCQRKEYIRSFSVEDIKLHQFKYQKVLKSNQSFRKYKINRLALDSALQETQLKFYKPQIKALIDEERLKESEEIEKKQKLKLKLIEKQKYYGNLVQELYSLSSSPTKLLSSAKKSRIKKISSHRDLIHNKNRFLTNSHSKKLFFPIKNLENPKKTSISPIKSINLLVKNKKITPNISHQFKRIKHIHNKVQSPEIEEISVIKNIAKNIEQQTKKLEVMCRTPGSIFLKNEILSNAYINSIQAKIVALDKIYSKRYGPD